MNFAVINILLLDLCVCFKVGKTPSIIQYSTGKCFFHVYHIYTLCDQLKKISFCSCMSYIYIENVFAFWSGCKYDNNILGVL